MRRARREALAVLLGLLVAWVVLHAVHTPADRNTRPAPPPRWDATVDRPAPPVTTELPKTGPPPTPEHLGELVRALRSRNLKVQVAAQDELRELGPAAAPAVSELADVLRDGDRPARCAAAEVLIWVGPAAVGAKKELLQALASPEDPARIFAAVGVGGIGHEAQEAIPLLGECLSSPDHGLRMNASWGLGRFAESGVPIPSAILRKGLGDTDANVRGNILSAIRFLGAQASDLAPDAAALLGDSDAHVRARACDALSVMDRAALPFLGRIRPLKDDADSEVRASAREAAGWLTMVERMPPDAVVETQQ